MEISPIPENEKERLAAIQKYHILDTEDEQDFDDIVQLVTQLCNTPMGLITLVDEKRQWFKARAGMTLRETDRSLSFCSHAIHEEDVMIVSDALLDYRFSDNPLVTGDPNIRFYAGMPLVTADGYKLGTISVLDKVPRQLNEQQLNCLRILGKQVVNLLNLRYNILMLKESNKKIESLERKKAEVSIRHAEERYRNIFENAVEGIFQANHKWRLITVNPSMAKMFDYSSPSKMISSVRDFSKQLYPNPKERALLLKKLTSEGAANGIEIKIKKKDKKTLWAISNIHSVENNDGENYFEGTLEDITNRKKAEEKLKAQYEELQKTNYELDRFVYSVSHDLRAPLTSMLGLINISELEDLSATHRQYLDMMRSCINRLDYFIKDILNYSQNTRTDILCEKINFYKIIEETKTALRHIPEAEHLTINLEIEDGIPFCSDSSRIKVLLHNLISNAIKYQDMNKKFSMLFLRIETSEEKCTIISKDNGIGIHQKHIDKIFNLFYRASHHSKGSGLGLYITKETVDKLSGQIKVESELGKFTTFEIEIPNLLHQKP